MLGSMPKIKTNRNVSSPLFYWHSLPFRGSFKPSVKKEGQPEPSAVGAAWSRSLLPSSSFPRLGGPRSTMMETRQPETCATIFD